MAMIKCSRCLFEIKETDNLYLSVCKHRICNECHLNENTDALFQQLISCKVCHSISQEIEKNMEVAKREISSTLEDDNTIVDLEIVLEPNEASTEASAREKCDECSEADATVRCDNCDIILCDPCFTVVHRHKSFKKHQKILLSHFKCATLFTKDCPKHKLPFEYFCEVDSVLICTDCFFVGDHKQHTSVTIKQKNNECRKLLEEAIELGKTSSSTLEVKKETEREMEIRTTYKDQYKNIDEVSNSFISKLEARAKEAFEDEDRQESRNESSENSSPDEVQSSRLDTPSSSSSENCSFDEDHVSYDISSSSSRTSCCNDRTS